ncbi:MAG: dTMP kinase [Archaeoglobaceae archaeon]|nr:dTMP kinase [Archaeoglobaceae archaeon]
MKGLLIAIEGIDGAGKTTIARHLIKFLSEKGYDCSLFKEPSESIYGDIIRKSKNRLEAEEELRLFLLDREIDVKERIKPALERGKIVIMDRYYYSNIAYQSARGLNSDEIRSMNERIAPKPDLVILLDLNPKIAMLRLKDRKDLTVFEQKDYLEKVRQKFLEIADEKTIIINAEKNLEKVKEEVEKAVMELIEKRKLI